MGKVIGGMVRVYKVVCRENGKLYSAIVEGKAKIEYRPGKWVKAPGWLAKKGFHLFAFKSLENAIEFAKPSKDLEVWEAEAEGVTEDLPGYCDFLELAFGRFLRDLGGRYPPGTVMCKRLKLVKKIEEE